MKIETKFENGEKVWVLNMHTMKAVEREIIGTGVQVMGNKTKVMYGFMKDVLSGSDGSTIDPYFWIPERACFKNRDELINTLNK